MNVSKVDVAIASLLSMPLTALSNIDTVLDLKHFASVIQYFSPLKAREFANKIAQSVLTQEGVALKEPEKVGELFKFIQPIVVESGTEVRRGGRREGESQSVSPSVRCLP